MIDCSGRCSLLFPRSSPDGPAHGDAMNAFALFVPVVAGLVLLMSITPSWGQPVCVAPGCNPTTSDANENTAGGTDALSKLVSGPLGGFANTAFGLKTLLNNTTGIANTATGIAALFSNTTGGNNTATGADALE